MTVTVSDAFSAVDVAADVSGAPETAPERTGPHARMRARDYRSLPVVGKVRALAAAAVADLRAAWWTPASLPTLRQAWVERIPDRDRVPGGSRPLWVAWLGYSHTVGLAVPALAVAAAGALTALVWVAQ